MNGGTVLRLLELVIENVKIRYGEWKRERDTTYLPADVIDRLKRLERTE